MEVKGQRMEKNAIAFVFLNSLQKILIPFFYKKKYISSIFISLLKVTLSPYMFHCKIKSISKSVNWPDLNLNYKIVRMH